MAEAGGTAASRCILTTGNIMTAGAHVIRKPTMEKSNTELLNSLRETLSEASALQPSDGDDDEGAVNGAAGARRPVCDWTAVDGDGVLYIPARETDPPGLAEDREEYDVTVKLFYLPSAPASARPAYAADAVRHVCKELNTTKLDTLIVSFPSISFDADDDAELLPDDSATTTAAAAATATTYPEAEVSEWASTYEALEALHDAGTISRLGISEFGTARLSQFLPRVRVKPGVDQINVRDCCVVPKPLILYAKEQGIELLTHNDCTNILSEEELQRLVVGEFGVCQGRRKLVPQWVIKYTAVIRSRGVVENKGYVAMADIR